MDWQSGFSVLVAIQHYVEVCAWSERAADDGVFQISSRGQRRSVSLDAPPTYRGGFLDSSEAACRVFAAHTGFTGAVVAMNGDLPSRGGLSSSAASIMAVLAALNSLSGCALSVDELCSLGYRVEHFELGTGAGPMDFFGCSAGGTNVIDCSSSSPQVEPITLPESACLVLVDSGERRRAEGRLAAKRDLERFADQDFIRYTNETARIVDLMRAELATGTPRLQVLGGFMTEAHGLLRECVGSSTAMLDRAVASALAGGALGAKLTGAGGGGFVVALCEEQAVSAILTSCQSAGLNAWAIDVDACGLQISLTDT